jgi:membrane protein implicated in regulation of membrane protease activity
MDNGQSLVFLPAGGEVAYGDVIASLESEVWLMVVAWLVIGALLLLFELHHLAFYALFGTVGSIAAAIVAVFAPSALPAQAAVAVGVALAGVVTVRPLVSKAFGHNHGGQVARGVHGGLAGQEAITLDAVGDTHLVGHVRLAGERWLAVSGGDGTIAAGTPVLVTAVQGTTLVVWPVNGVSGGPAEIGSPDRDEAPDKDGRTP